MSIVRKTNKIEHMKDRQKEIIEATGKILTTSGVKGLTIKNLAHEMKFSESAIYRHFTGKEAIIVAMLNYLSATMDKRLTNVIAGIDHPEEQLKKLFQSQFSFFHKNPHFVVAVFSDGLMEQNGNINDAILKIMEVKMKHLKPIIKKGQQKGIFTKAISTEHMIHIVMASFRFQIFKWRLDDFHFDIKKRGNNTILSVLKLIKKS